uniref:Uncharacterized protein n=1 Tax=Chromera velia CCMP2878 TaxID=1169474 RepID=A0A0G4F0Q9_9ALVE|eukprot:Cvel_2599.t1-p1 / transcript=Cvel_2599.t1 / gene=Cvel_2599 / organism=Chromera_velia_CCMP2878 / gene_product=hypothetical protein / transcript_product=hypothetical protein / location=Cvel_scaffold102:136601-137568(+) / protein_length=77 / sequence_SO=supercontig / SO=protein_coding / is_pseudo=false
MERLWWRAHLNSVKQGFGALGVCRCPVHGLGNMSFEKMWGKHLLTVKNIRNILLMLWYWDPQRESTKVYRSLRDIGG